MQSALFHESFADAVTSAVLAVGGWKKAAGLLWPTMKPESAYARLKACVDDGKAEQLKLDEIVGLGRLARDAGDLSMARYLAAEWGLAEPVVRDPVDQADELRREVRDLLVAANQRLARIERVETQIRTVR
jgi:hypothetical protein